MLDPGQTNFTRMQVISEDQYLQAMDRYNDDGLKVGMGAEAVRGLLEELERRHILLEDVDGAVAAVEAEKAYFVDAESGHRLGAWRPRNVTFWVEYTEEDGRWLLHDAWCHRMRVPGSGGVQENGCCGEA